MSERMLHAPCMTSAVTRSLRMSFSSCSGIELDLTNRGKIGQIHDESGQNYVLPDWTDKMTRTVSKASFMILPTCLIEHLDICALQGPFFPV